MYHTLACKFVIECFTLKDVQGTISTFILTLMFPIFICVVFLATNYRVVFCKPINTVTRTRISI